MQDAFISTYGEPRPDKTGPRPSCSDDAMDRADITIADTASLHESPGHGTFVDECAWVCMIESACSPATHRVGGWVGRWVLDCPVTKPDAQTYYHRARTGSVSHASLQDLSGVGPQKLSTYNSEPMFSFYGAHGTAFGEKESAREERGGSHGAFTVRVKTPGPGSYNDYVEGEVEGRALKVSFYLHCNRILKCQIL